MADVDSLPNGHHPNDSPTSRLQDLAQLRDENGNNLAESNSASPAQSGAASIIPSLYWLPKYNVATNFKGDLAAGIGVGFLLIPQAIAYSSIAQLPPHYGLWSAIVRSFTSIPHI